MKDLLKYLFDENSFDDMFIFFMLFAIVYLFWDKGEYLTAKELAIALFSAGFTYLKKKK